MKNDVLVDDVSAGDECWVVAKKTPFYVAGGGQVGDQGIVIFDSFSIPILELKKISNAIFIKITAPVHVKIGDGVIMEVDQQSRLDTMKNHTATHLLQASLQKTLGNGVKQAGSFVSSDYLRFDFTYHKSLTSEDIKSIEDLVNQKVCENISVVVQQMTYKKALDLGITAFFGDKYNPDSVRAIMIDSFSSELCGGTHVKATGDIGIFKIIEEVALAVGQRRIVALTGRKALAEYQQDFSLIKNISLHLNVKPQDLEQSVHALGSEIKDLQKEVRTLKTQMIQSQIVSWAEKIELVKNIPFLYLDTKGYVIDELREIGQLLQKQRAGFYFIMQNDGGKNIFFAVLDKSLMSLISMQNFKQWLQETFKLHGGGNQMMLQGGGNNVDSKACQEGIKEWLRLQIK